MATKRLKELLEARKSSARDNTGYLFAFHGTTSCLVAGCFLTTYVSKYMLSFPVTANGHASGVQVFDL